MIVNPRKGQAVQAWYSAKWHRWAHLHGQIGTVIRVGNGKPRSHLVLFGDMLYVIPCGHLRKPPTEGEEATT